MTYNVFSGTLNPTQSINRVGRNGTAHAAGSSMSLAGGGIFAGMRSACDGPGLCHGATHF